MSEQSQTATRQMPEVVPPPGRYETPELRLLGSLSDLTKGAGISANRDDPPFEHLATST